MATGQVCSVCPSGGPCWSPGREVSRWGGLLCHLLNSLSALLESQSGLINAKHMISHPATSQLSSFIWTSQSPFQ